MAEEGQGFRILTAPILCRAGKGLRQALVWG